MWTLFHSILHTHQPERDAPQAAEDSGFAKGKGFSSRVKWL
jgi:hypothetical protein